MVRAAEPQELDVHALLRLFVSTVESGAPATYPTYRDAWQKMKFSFIYEGCKERHLSQDYISWLLAAASDHFWAPLPRRPSSATPVEAADVSAPATLEACGSENLMQQLPGIGGAAEAKDRLEPMLDLPELLSHHALGGSVLQSEVAPTPLAIDNAASSSGPSPVAVTGHPRTLPLDEHSLLAMLMDNDEMEATEPDQQILAALKVPSLTGASTAAAQDNIERPSFTLKAGALYTIYTIYKTQPAYKGRRVRPYLPVSSLQAIADMLPEARHRQIPDIPAIVKCLVQEQAFVIGGVRRPPAGHQIVRDGPVRMAQVDMSERNAMRPMTMRHLANTQLALRELKHVQLLCDSYSNAQRSVFAAADPDDMPPSIADLGMGERFRDLTRQIMLSVHGILSGDAAHVSKKQKMANQKAAAPAAEVQYGDIETSRHQSAKRPAREMQADLSEVDLGGLPSMAKAVERKQGCERAEILSRQREWAERGARALAAAEDMPDDLGHPARQGDMPAQAPVAGQAVESLGVSPTAVKAAAAEHRGQPPGQAELAAVASRPAQDHSTAAHGNGLINGNDRPTQKGHEPNGDLAGELTAAQAIASVFGEDSSSSADDSDLHDRPAQQAHDQSHEQLELPARLPGKCKALSRPNNAMEEKGQASKKPSTRSAISGGEAGLREALGVPRAKRRGTTAEHAGSARPKRRSVTAPRALNSSKVGQRPRHSKGSSGKPVVLASMCSQRHTKSSGKADLDQVATDTVDWKAYADALDVRIAEAEALLADDSG